MIELKRGQATQFFFDRAPVVQSMDRASLRVHSRFGAFVRRGARSSVRRRTKISEPGQPPSSHTGLFKDNIFFVYDKGIDGVVIGPILLNKADRDALALLEHGGAAERRFLVLERRRDGTVGPVDPKRKPRKTIIVSSRGGRKRRVRYRPRPTMGPALQRELPKLPQMWRDAMKG